MSQAKSLPAPKFRRLRCRKCGRVVPWDRLAAHEAILHLSPSGEPQADCPACHAEAVAQAVERVIIDGIVGDGKRRDEGADEQHAN